MLLCQGHPGQPTRKTMQKQMDLIDIEGSPREMGRSHGEQCRGRIAKELETTVAPLARKWRMPREETLLRFRAFLPMFQSIAPNLVQEMQGIAEGADRTFDEILFLNARHGGVQALEETSLTGDACTAFAAGPSTVAGGGVLAGQNKDSGKAALDRYYLLRTKPDKGARILALTYPGEVGHIGIGSGGVSVFGNALYGRRHPLGGPHNLARRPMLGCASVTEATAIFRGLAGWSEANYLVADADGRIADVEVLNGNVHREQISDGIYSHGNHVTHADFLAGEDFANRETESERRTCRLRECLEADAGALTPEHCMRALRNHDDNPQSVCRHKAPIHGGGDMWTTCSLVADMREGLLYVCKGNPCENEFVKVGFD